MKLSARDRRALALGTVAAAAILVYSGLVRPIARERAELQIRREAAVQLLDRYQRLVAARDVYAWARGTADARLSQLLTGVFLAEQAEDSVSQLLRLLEQAAEANAVRVLETSLLAVDSVSPRVLRIGATVECESDIAGVLGFLRSLESAERLLHVTDLHLTSVGIPGLSANDVETLKFSFDVRAFVVVPENETL